MWPDARQKLGQGAISKFYSRCLLLEVFSFLFPFLQVKRIDSYSTQATVAYVPTNHYIKVKSA